ncbi:hypothetical protein E2F48_04875 [Arthrobacter crusticola]|uniref:Uncharacterized protein n=1 Tax=Arthrobacter crusticola TaxID=2547960 RepID=A0A4R5TZ53_9MICC|nr:hypothetical protein [Arthrobacter crusticola]TDK26528.1 hypothetical protein E2F48_04875 [Arthrobacter crusticola]
MCGACGRTVAADETIGPGRTLRQHLLVASAVNALCAGLPGVPRVQVAGDSWQLRGATGAVTRCDTVAELWSAVAAACPASAFAQLAGRLAAERAEADGLTRRVIDAGLLWFSP